VTLIDLPEALPFGSDTPDSADLVALATQNSESETDRALFEFVKSLERNFGEKTCFIGEDIVGEKFYKRFLFEKGGFIEIMTGVPVAISAHFTTKLRSDKFSRALSASISKLVRNPKIREVLVSTIVSDQEADLVLNFEKWEKIKRIRGET
jgi:hypothetical protein